MADERILHKIKALLEKTVDHGCSEEEAKVAAGMAATLMAKHGIEAREVQDQSTKQGIDSSVTKVGVDKGRMLWLAELAAAVGKVCFCLAIRNSTEGTMRFVGTPDEVEACKHLFSFLAVQITFISAEKAAGKGKVYGDQFALGCAMRVAQRLLEKFNEEVAKHEQGTAIVRAADAENMAWANENLGNIRMGKAVSRRMTGGLADGFKAGNSIELQEGKSLSTKVNNGPKALA